MHESSIYQNGPQTFQQELIADPSDPTVDSDVYNNDRNTSPTRIGASLNILHDSVVRRARPLRDGLEISQALLR